MSSLSFSENTTLTLIPYESDDSVFQQWDNKEGDVCNKNKKKRCCNLEMSGNKKKVKVFFDKISN